MLFLCHFASFMPGRALFLLPAMNFPTFLNLLSSKRADSFGCCLPVCVLRRRTPQERGEGGTRCSPHSADFF